MRNKILISLLLVAVFNLFVGCTSYKVFTPAEFKEIEKDDKPDNLVFITNDGQIFNLTNSNYFIKNDSLFWQETITIDERWIPFEGKLAYNEIKEIEYYNDKTDWMYKLSISEYKKIEEQKGKPIEIVVNKNDSTKYYFQADNFYLSSDTLVGTGKLFLAEQKQISTKAISLSEIESLEFEYVSVLNRIIRGVVFFSIVSTAFFILILVTYPKNESW